MKRSLLLLGIGIFMLSTTHPSFAQVIELPEIEIVATNYKYLNSLGEEASIPVRELENAVADYDVKSADFYEDEYSTYLVSFYIPDGKILASYDGEGTLLRTAERFKNVNVPQAIKKAIAERFPNWSISKDIYRVTFHQRSGEAKKQYKLVLENGDKRMKVKIDETGEFI